MLIILMQVSTDRLSDSSAPWEDLALTKTLFEKEVLLCPSDSALDASFVEIIYKELNEISARERQLRPSFLSKLGSGFQASKQYVFR